MWDWPEGLQRRHLPAEFLFYENKKGKKCPCQADAVAVGDQQMQAEGRLAVWMISNLGSGQNVIALGTGQANNKNDVVELRFFIASHLFFS